MLSTVLWCLLHVEQAPSDMGVWAVFIPLLLLLTWIIISIGEKEQLRAKVPFPYIAPTVCEEPAVILQRWVC